MRPPKIIKPYVISFARRMLETTGDVDASYVFCNPVPEGTEHECFHVVENHARKHGGNCILGWAIWERSKLFIEAELHMIWESPEGMLNDITPRTISIPRILFVNDQNRRYKGRQIDNIRMPLTHDKDVLRILAYFKKRFQLRNHGNLADFHGEMNEKITPEMIRLDDEIAQIEYKITKRYGPWLPEQG